jgi:HD-like signal output (HDOD) protein
MSLDNEELSPLQASLRHHGADFGVVRLNPAVASLGKIKAVVLKDRREQKRIAIIGTHQLLDLGLIRNKFLQMHVVLTGSELQDFYSEQSINAEFILPVTHRLESVVDSELLSLKQIYIATDIPNQYIMLDQHNFRLLLGDAIIAPITQDVESVMFEENTYSDEKAVNTSLNFYTASDLRSLELPPMPRIAQEILRLQDKPNATITELVNIIQRDPSLSAQIIRWASSSYYATSGEINSLQDAIQRVLGFSVVSNIVLALALKKTMKAPREGAQGYLSVTEQSIYLALAVERLTRLVPGKIRPAAGRAYLIGLLNNIGYFVLAELFAERLPDIWLEMEANTHASVIAVERNALGIDRNQLAALLMEHWDMPSEISNALRQQDNPNYSGDGWPYALLVYMAKHLLRNNNLLTGASSEIFDTQVFSHLGVDQADAEEIIAQLVQSDEFISVARVIS